MTKKQLAQCAEMVEQIRKIVRQQPHPPPDFAEAVGELCDQLVMRLQPITIEYPQAP